MGFRADQVWPSPLKPAVQPVSSAALGQPMRHFSTGVVGAVSEVVASKA